MCGACEDGADKVVGRLEVKGGGGGGEGWGCACSLLMLLLEAGIQGGGSLRYSGHLWLRGDRG